MDAVLEMQRWPENEGPAPMIRRAPPYSVFEPSGLVWRLRKYDKTNN
jgi:hypothetical protein